MTRVFADSFFFFALLNPRDGAHTKAVDFSRRNRGPLLTTAWVLTELADGLAGVLTTIPSWTFCKSLFATSSGLEDGHGGRQSMTIHPGGRRDSAVDFHDEAWLDFNMMVLSDEDRYIHGQRGIFSPMGGSGI